MQQIVFHLQTVTPMFMAGADGECFELRPPSVKGAVRFWWRAQHWGTREESLVSTDIEREEGTIFGTTNNGGQKSSLILQVQAEHLQPSQKKFHMVPFKTASKGRTFSINILEYLAYGTYDYERGRGNVFNREYVPEGQSFTLKFRTREEHVADEVMKSFYLLSMFGGLGAKTHNGFGSIAVTNPEIFAQYGLPERFPDKAHLIDSGLLKNPHLPTFSALSTRMKMYKLRSSKAPCHDWNTCLGQLGTIYRQCREQLEPKHRYKKRQYIGAPIVTGRTTHSLLKRRAKPYFLKVIKEQNGFQGYIIYLPAEYCAGLKEDGQDRLINHREVNKEFKLACEQFNAFLERQMEVVL